MLHVRSLSNKKTAFGAYGVGRRSRYKTEAALKCFEYIPQSKSFRIQDVLQAICVTACMFWIT